MEMGMVVASVYTILLKALLTIHVTFFVIKIGIFEDRLLFLGTIRKTRLISGLIIHTLK